ncbi:hypothetical protein J5226_12915 [Lysobacter sp. K5869]|uniref:hypothetical protein n=1 Tax=Lysobacter sp. K5869 TaxID=2820808 RepID=UPI001C0618BC|nr:hypothetical protein [Lysobacter sp. K5869]QWP79226.1 hypothetical protein J5226_12915 [Lysobacter sp. K5869]
MLIEYPKMLYVGGDPAAKNIIVKDEAQERSARESGYFSAGEDPHKAAREEQERIEAALRAAEEEQKRAEAEVAAARAEAERAAPAGKVEADRPAAEEEQKRQQAEQKAKEAQEAGKGQGKQAKGA